MGGFHFVCLNGGDEAEVCFKLGMHDDGVRRAKLFLSRFMFSPALTPCCNLALARLLGATGCDGESSECYARAVNELRRMGLHMFELMALCEKGESTTQTVSKMVEDPAVYSQLVK